LRDIGTGQALYLFPPNTPWEIDLKKKFEKKKKITVLMIMGLALVGAE